VNDLFNASLLATPQNEVSLIDAELTWRSHRQGECQT
jgi:hypothetical protein